MVAIGRVSYSLYLWHWPVFVLFRWTVGLDTAITQATAVVLFVALSIASYHLVEQPLRSNRTFSGWSDRRWVGMGVLAIVLGVVVYTGMARSQKHISFSSVSRAPLDWYAYAKSLKTEYPGCRLKRDTLSVESGSAWLFQRGACDLEPGKPMQLFVLGDSHALAYNEMLQRFVIQSGASVKLYSSGGCAIGSRRESNAVSPQCAAYESNSLVDVEANARAGDVLFLPGLRLPRLSEPWALFDAAQAFAEVHGEESEAARRVGETVLIERLTPLAERGVLIVFEAPKPILPGPPHRCSDWFNRHNPICAKGLTIARDYMERFRAPVVASLGRTAQQLPHATVWDPLPILCDAQQCPGLRDGRPLFFDGDHLSGHGNRALLEGFSKHVEAQHEAFENRQ
jgi:Predicted acyltransferases